MPLQRAWKGQDAFRKLDAIEWVREFKNALSEEQSANAAWSTEHSKLDSSEAANPDSTIGLTSAPSQRQISVTKTYLEPRL